jgi:hypothetical protein
MTTVKMAMCPRCKVVHEAVGPKALDGADEERAYRITHCRLCKSPSLTFSPLPDEPDLADDELGYPMAVVPWVNEGPAQPVRQRRVAEREGAPANSSRRKAK